MTRNDRQFVLAALSVFRGDCWKRFEERLRIWMSWRSKYGIHGAPLDNLSGVKNQNAIGEAGEERWIVGNEHHGEAKLLPEGSKNVKDLHLGYGVECGSRLVSNHNGGITGDGLGDEGALPLAAAELVGIRAHDAVCILRKKLRENFARALVQIFFPRGLVRDQHLANLLADADGRMESERRLLKD